MNNKAKIAIVAGAVLLLIVLLYFFGFSKEDDSYINDSWEETYDPEDLGPYGTYMLKELLDTTGMFGNFLELDKDLKDALEDNPDKNDIYFFVGKENFLTDSSTQYLLDFIREGNTGFMACEKFPPELIDKICEDRDEFMEEDLTIDSVQYFKFNHPELEAKRYTFNYVYNNRKKLKTWRYFNQEKFDLDEEDTLYHLGGNNKGGLNFLKIKYGEGYLFLNSSPYVFTNISMMKRDGFQYIENVLKHVPPGRVQWDKYNLQWHKKNRKKRKKGGEKRQSILEFIMKNPPLLWAFLLLVIGAVLYALFKGKRKQKVITPTESKKNMSLQYINTLSSLYLQEKRHNKLIRLKEKTFLNFIGERYYIHCSKPDDKFMDKLAAKSHISKSDIADIFSTFNELEHAAVVTDQELIELHQKIETFYKTCR